MKELNEEQRNEISRKIREEHEQVKVGRCSCGREFFGTNGKHSRKMWLTHLFYEDVQALKRAEEEA